MKEINAEQEINRIVEFIRQKTEENSWNGCVLGLSGGLDSSVCVTLAVKALGEDKVLGIIMPAGDSNPNDAEDAIRFAGILGIKTITHPVAWLLNTFQFKELDFEKEVKPLLIKPTSLLPRPVDLPYVMRLRGRMYILGYYAFMNNYFQCQTLQKTEWMLGWFDKFGDAAGDIAPIFHLYKTQVRQLAEYLKLPDFILNRAPTSGNDGLTDEEELGMTIAEVDPILYYLERGLIDSDIAKLTGIELNEIERIRNQVNFSSIHRQMPVFIERRENGTNRFSKYKRGNRWF